MALLVVVRPRPSYPPSFALLRNGDRDLAAVSEEIHQLGCCSASRADTGPPRWVASLRISRPGFEENETRRRHFNRATSCRCYFPQPVKARHQHAIAELDRLNGRLVSQYVPKCIYAVGY
jgi:hypothetical protein